MMGDNMSGMMLAMDLFWLLLVIVLVFAIAALVKFLASGRRSGGDRIDGPE